jgi:hypothetical protein
VLGASLGDGDELHGVGFSQSANGEGIREEEASSEAA